MDRTDIASGPFSAADQPNDSFRKASYLARA